MSIAFARSSGPYPVCSQARERLAAFPVLGAGREERAEGKIKETGTTGRRFLGGLFREGASGHAVEPGSHSPKRMSG